MKKILLTLIACLIFPQLGRSSYPQRPKVTETTINGVWEAIYTDNVIRVFRMEISPDGISVLSHAVSSDNAYVSTLEQRKIEDGNIELLFRDKSRKMSYTVDGQEYTDTGKNLIKGTGRASDSYGVLEVELVSEPDSPKPKIWKLRFFKLNSKTLTDVVKEEADCAAESARKEKEDNQRVDLTR